MGAAFSDQDLVGPAEVLRQDPFVRRSPGSSVSNDYDFIAALDLHFLPLRRKKFVYNENLAL